PHPVSPGHHPCSGLNAGATNGHQRSTLLPAKPAAPSNLPHLPSFMAVMLISADRNALNLWLMRY
ncbi:hypothetical protein, partial [Rhizobium ruizarguesonis]|uniref:hypothetical protein n=1 Tax=Rhizobium ruizarguesonis TaxID=2081791 RepID=UPI001A8F2C4E